MGNQTTAWVVKWDRYYLTSSFLFGRPVFSESPEEAKRFPVYEGAVAMVKELGLNFCCEFSIIRITEDNKSRSK